jgi:hypothetical protein
LPENIHFFELWKIRGNLGGKVGSSGISVYSEEKNAAIFIFTYFLETTLNLQQKPEKLFFKKCRKNRKNKIVEKYFSCFTLKPKTKHIFRFSSMSRYVFEKNYEKRPRISLKMKKNTFFEKYSNFDFFNFIFF